MATTAATPAPPAPAAASAALSAHVSTHTTDGTPVLELVVVDPAVAPTAAAAPAPAPTPAPDPTTSPTPAPGGAMDQFLAPMPPGREESRHLFVTTHKWTVSALDRTRKTVAPKPQPEGSRKRAKRGANGLSGSNPKGISAAARVKEFPNDSLDVSAGSLFCCACSSRLGTRRSTIMSHIGLTAAGTHIAKPNKHMKKMVLFNANKAETPQRMQRFSEFCERNNTYGKNLQPENSDQRCTIIRQLMSAGVLLSKLDDLVPMFNGLRANMCGSSKGKEYIGFIAEEEMRRTREEVAGKCVSVAIDCTPFSGTEVSGVTVRAVGADLKVIKRVASIHMLAASMNNKHIAAELMDAISKKLDIQDKALVICFNFDGASANRAAFRDTIPIFFTNSVFVACMSHLMDNTGKQIDAERASDLQGKLCSVFSHSFQAKRELKKLTDRSWPRHVAHRWGSMESSMKCILEEFAQVEVFIRTYRNSDGKRNKSCEKLQAKYLDNVNERRLLLVEISLYTDILNTLKTACLTLEGDGALAFKTYGVIQTVVATLRLDDLNAYPVLPNVESLLRGDLSGQPTAADVAALRNHVIVCLKDIREYATRQFGSGADVKFRQELDLFKAARIINFAVARQGNPDEVDPGVLSIFPFISNDDITNLRKELPAYLTAAANARATYPVRSFWVDNQTTLPAWYSVVEKLWLVQPSSAMMERVFSVLNNVFGKQQTVALNDLVKTTVMVRFNDTDCIKGTAAQVADLVEDTVIDGSGGGSEASGVSQDNTGVAQANAAMEE